MQCATYPVTDQSEAIQDCLKFTYVRKFTQSSVNSTLHGSLFEIHVLTYISPLSEVTLGAETTKKIINGSRLAHECMYRCQSDRRYMTQPTNHVIGSQGVSAMQSGELHRDAEWCQISSVHSTADSNVTDGY
jgi:hypothetical protein